MNRTSRHAPIPIPEQALCDFLFERAHCYAEKAALIDGLTGRTLSYGELLEAIRQMAAGLSRRGVQHGSVVALVSPNTPEYVIAFLAVARVGGTLTTIGPLSTEAELTYQLRDSGARLLITSPELLRKATAAGARAGLIREVVVLGPGSTTPLGDALEDAGTTPSTTLDLKRDTFAILYSSGTTGLPKGVMLTQYNIVANVSQLEAAEDLEPNDKVLGTVPFSHAYGMLMVMNLALRVGATLITMARFEIKSFLEAVEKYRATVAHVVPPVVGILAKHASVDEYDLSSLRTIVSAAAVLQESIARLCADRNHCSVRQAYGMTECGFTHVAPPDGCSVSSVGFVLPNTEFRIVDIASGGDASVDALGEVWVRGPQVMKGYLGHPEETKRIIDHAGWLHTGDIGHTAADGSLFVIDRAKNLLKFRGLQYRDKELLQTIVDDIAARREATRRINFLALLLDSVRESVVAVDVNNKVIFWNRGAEGLFQYSANEAIGRSIDKLIIPAESDSPARELEQVKKTGRWQGQSLRRRKDGKTIWTDLVASSIRDSAGHFSGVVAIHRDITELRRNAEIVRESRERMRNLASRLMVIREEERAALSRELHDELGQIITRLRIDLSWLVKKLPKHLKIERTEAILPLIDKTLGTIRHISARLRPSILDEAGLAAAIEWQAKEFEAWNDCRCRLDLRLHNLSPDRDRDTAVFRILQEALTNIARHSQAKATVVRARVSRGELILKIEDNGIGFPDGKLASALSLGVIGMRERAESANGHVEFSPRPKGGTIVTLRVPAHSAMKDS